MNYLLIGIAGAVGAIARYAVGGYVSTNTNTAFPLETLIINVSGSLVLGFVATAGFERFVANPDLRTALTIGFLGAYTTFSTLSLETLRLIENGSYGLALLNAFGSLTLGFLAAWIGVVLARAI